MNRPHGFRILLVLALVLLLGGFAGSAVYWSASGGRAVLAVQEGYGEVIAAAAGRDSAAALSAAAEHWNRVDRATRLAEAHAHLLFLCILLILFAMLLAGTSRADQRRRGLAWLGAGGVLIYPAGLIVQAAGFVTAGQVLAAAGAVLILLFAGRIVAALFRPQTELQPPGRDEPGRTA